MIPLARLMVLVQMERSWDLVDVGRYAAGRGGKLGGERGRGGGSGHSAVARTLSISTAIFKALCAVD